MLKRLFVFLVVLCSALLSSQAPEFAQQYRQRLGGAIDELRSVVDNFDQDAKQQGLSRHQALQELITAQQAFFQSRGASMQNTIDRFTDLTGQQQRFNSLNPALRPTALLTKFDKTILQGTWQDYQPALPLSLFGAIWAGIGGGLGWIIVLLFSAPFSSKQPKRRRRAQDPKF